MLKNFNVFIHEIKILGPDSALYQGHLFEKNKEIPILSFSENKLSFAFSAINYIVFLFNIKISVLCYQGKMLSKLGLCILLFVEGFSYALAGRVKVIYLINPFPDL